jgi:hypothetical protein
MSHRSRRHRLAAALAFAATMALAVAPTAMAGEIKDSNEELEKIVWAVEAESERDPELSVGGESVQVEPGDLITFRVAVNEDDVEEDDDGVAVIDDVFKKADLEYVSGDAEFDPEDCDPPAVASAPAENKVTCRVTLGPDGNARLYLTFRVLPPSGNPQACVPGTNVVNTDGGSSAAEGGDQAQYEICPEGSLAGEGTAGEGAAGAGGAGEEGGSIPNTAMPAPVASSPWLAVALLIGAISAHALARRGRSASR